MCVVLYVHEQKMVSMGDEFKSLVPCVYLLLTSVEVSRVGTADREYSFCVRHDN